MSDFSRSRGVAPTDEKPVRGRRSSGKPTEAVDAAVVELSGGFTVGGLQDKTYIAGQTDSEHWIMASWNPSNFDLFDISEDARTFLRRHLSAIAYKANPGAQPDIDYFTTPQLALNRMLMLQQKHGAPFGFVNGVVNDVSPDATPTSGQVVERLTVDRSVE